MSEALKKLRAERHRQYQQLDDDDKPKIEICPDCHMASYLKEVCSITGLMHELHRKKLVGGSIVDGNAISGATLMEAIDRTRVRWQESRTQLVRCDAQSLNIFQSFVSQLEWGLQRYGILYGLYDADNKAVEVHAVYEPEQHGNKYTFEVTEDPRIPKIDAIAAGLGLRRVGVVCTHPPRDAKSIVLTSRELLLCAREQSRFGDECVVLTVSPNMEEGGVVQCQAWQTSQQCVHYFRLNMLHEASATALASLTKSSATTSAAATTSPASSLSTPPPQGNLEQTKYVESDIELEVTQEDTDANGKQRFITKEPSKLVDTRWFTSYIAVQQFESTIVRGAFMRISRPGMAPPTFANLRNYMMDPKRKDALLSSKLADFHVLVFLAEMFSMEDDLPRLIDIAKGEASREVSANYEAILKAYMDT